MEFVKPQSPSRPKLMLIGDDRFQLSNPRPLKIMGENITSSQGPAKTGRPTRDIKVPPAAESNKFLEEKFSPA